jgi:hypothetical protein
VSDSLDILFSLTGGVVRLPSPYLVDRYLVARLLTSLALLFRPSPYTSTFHLLRIAVALCSYPQQSLFLFFSDPCKHPHSSVFSRPAGFALFF